MRAWILVHPDINKCFDYVETPTNDIPFPVAEPLTWVNVTNYAVKPAHSWKAENINNVWEFTPPEMQI